MRLVRCVANDVRLQWRAGLYGVYVVIVAAYGLVLGALDPSLRRSATALMIYIDPSVLGFFFLGGLMLFERGDGVLDALFVGPLRAGEYIVAKGLSLTLLALLSSLALAFAGGVVPTSAGLLFAGVALTSLMITFFAVAVGSRLTTVNRYFFGGALCALPLIAPVFETLGLLRHPLLRWLPAAPGLALIDAGLGGPPLGSLDVVWAIVLLLLWNGAAFLVARRWFQRHVIGAAR